MPDEKYNRFLGKACVLSGQTAIDMIESAVSDVRRCGFPASFNLNGFRLTENAGEFASVIGMTTAGLRAAVRVDSSVTTPMIRECARRRLPLVLHIGDFNDRPDILDVAENAGYVILVASSVQALVDLTVVAHRIAEDALVPVMIDCGRLHDVIENVSLPPGHVLQSCLGNSDDWIDCPTPSQSMTFGRTRRRVPNWIHPDIPVFHGAAYHGTNRVFEIMAHREYVQSHLDEIIDVAFSTYSQATNWPVSSVRMAGPKKTDIVLTAWGMAWPAVEAVTRSGGQKHVGSMEVVVRHPFPAARVVALTVGKTSIASMDEITLSEEGALCRNITSALDKAVQNGLRKRQPPYPDIPALTEKKRPSVTRVSYAGSLTCNEVVRIIGHIRSDGSRHLLIGAEFSRATSRFPKQQIWFHRIRQDYPALSEKVVSPDTDGWTPNDKTLTVAIHLREAAADRSELEYLSLWVSRRWNVKVHADVGTDTCFLRCSTASLAPEVDSTVYDVLIAQTVPLSLIKALRPSGRLIVLGDKRRFSPSITRAIHEKTIQIEHADFVAHGSIVLYGLMTRVAADFYDEAIDVSRETGAIVKFLRAEYELELSNDQLTVLEAALNERPVAEAERVLTPQDNDVPMGIRRYADRGPGYSRISQFYDRAGYFFHADSADGVTADPFYAVPVLPLATSGVTHPAGSDQLPVFRPSSCTACGLCYIHCPHAAIPPILISPESILQSAVDQLASHQIYMKQLNPPMLKTLARFIQQIFLSDPPPETFGHALDAAEDKLMGHVKPGPDTEQLLRDEVRQIRSIVGKLPTAVTQKFWRDAEGRQKGTGLLFSLAVDSQACTGCGICADICPEDALEMEPLSETSNHTELFQLWESLPDTPGHSIQKWIQDDSTDPFSILLLSRNYYLSQSRGNTTDSASERIASHLVSALAESIVQSHVLKVVAVVDKNINDLSAALQAKLAGAIPFERIEELAAGLAGSEKTRVALDELIAKSGPKKHFVDTAWIERVARLISDLKNLSWMLKSGPSGVGRTRFASVIGSTMPWATRFPHNPMTQAAVLWDSGQSAEYVTGLCRGHLRQFMDNVRLLRRAELEVKGQYDRTRHDEMLAHLTWSELSEDEKCWIPPILWITGPDILSESRLRAFFDLLRSDLPVKTVILNPADGNADELLAQATTLYGLLSARAVPIVQSCLADPRHMFTGIAEAIRTTRPAVIHLLTPAGRPDDWLSTWQLAVHARAFPLFRYRPGHEWIALGMDLSGNPHIDKDWAPIRESTYTPTYADWAFRSARWESQFRPVTDNEKICTVPEALGGDCNTPVVSPDCGSGSAVFAVPSGVMDACKVAQAQWKMMRELGGLLSPHPVKLKESLETEWATKQEAALEKVKSEYEEKLREQERTQLEIMKKKIRDKLMQMAGYTQS